MLRRLLLNLVCSLVLLTGFSGAFAPRTVFAASPASVEAGFTQILEQGIIFANICDSAAVPGQTDSCECRALGHCSLNNILQFAVNITIFILGISGSVALLMFFYGGLLWVNSQGRTDFVDAGKDTLKHAVIGLAIIFSAYAFVNYVLAALLGTASSGNYGTIEQTINGATGIDASSVIKSNTEANH